MKIFLYWLLSTLLSVSLLSALFANINNIAALATMPILFDGAIGVSLKLYKNSTIPPLYHVNSYPGGCDGLWSCFNMICELYNKTEHNNIKYIAIDPNQRRNATLPLCSKDINIWLDTWTSYQITKYSLIFAAISIAISSAIALLFILLKRRHNKTDIIINQPDEQEISPLTSLGFSAFLFILRCPIYVSFILLYGYLIPDLQIIDHPPSQIQSSEYLTIFSLLSAYLIDNFIFPFEIVY